MSNFALTGTTSNWITSQTLPTATVDNSITNDNAGTLSALVTGATYQWMDCTNSNTPVSGATFQTFSPATVGNYAVQISKNGCTATSVCETVASILNNSSNGFSKSISMHPNPSNGITNIQLSESYETIEATLYNVTGQTILNTEFKNTNSFTFEINGAKGIYFLSIKTNSGEDAILKVIKK